MNTINAASFVKDSAKLTDIFGYWPHFHDAHVMELSLSRGDVRPEKERYTFPILEVTLHVSKMSRETDEEGFFMFSKHTLAVLRFRDVDSLSLTGFNHVNQIYGISFGLEERGHFTNGEPLPPYILVEFESGFGMGARFKCFGVEVVSAEACSEDGKVPGCNGE